MQKNTAGKWVVFAYGLPDHANDGQPISGDALNITADVRIDGAAANATDDLNPTELGNGYYIFDITAVEANGDNILLDPVSATGSVQVIGVPGAAWTRPPNFEAMGIETDGDLTKCNLVATTTTNTDLAAVLTDTEASQVSEAAILVDTEAVPATISTLLVDTEASRVDEAAILVDTEAAITERSTILTDTEAVLVDTEAASPALVADAVWDELLSGSSHNISTSAGRRLRQLEEAFVMAEGVIAVATNTHTFTLDTGSVATADYYIGARLQIEEGAGAGQSRIIIAYSLGRVAILDSDFTTIPDTSSRYSIVAADVHTSVSDADLAEGYVAVYTNTTTITLDATIAPATTDFYVGELIVFTNGTGKGQAREITAYTSGRVVTMSPALTVALDTTTVWHIQAVVSIPEMVDEIWDEAQSDHTTAGTFGEVATETAAILVDSEAVLTDTEAAITERSTILTDTESISTDTEASQTTEAAILVDTEAVPATISTLLVDTEASQVAETAILADTEAAITARSTILTDTEAVLVDTEAATGVITDTEAILTDTGTTIPAQITALNNISAANVNTEVVDVIRTDTATELSAVPAASPDLMTMVQFIYMALRNKMDVTATTKEIHNDAGTIIGTKTLSDDATTYSETKAS